MTAELTLPRPAAERGASAAEDVFGRVVVGVDGDEQGFEAVWQASRLVSPGGWLEAFCVVDLGQAVLAGLAAGSIASELERDAVDALERATRISGFRARSRLVRGPPIASFLRELREADATLAVVGTHGRPRVAEIVIGSVAGDVLHRAPCSVYVARPPAAEALFPRTIVVGYDGSRQSEDALAVGRDLAERFAATLTVVTGIAGKGVDRERAHEAGAITLDEQPVEALVDASGNADILVVGSRGLHGLRALGSVSERIAHDAVCSVLVVRGSGRRR